MGQRSNVLQKSLESKAPPNASTFRGPQSSTPSDVKAAFDNLFPGGSSLRGTYKYMQMRDHTNCKHAHQ